MPREMTFANIYPNILNVAIIGMAATIWIALMKWLTNKYNVPGLNTLYAQI